MNAFFFLPILLTPSIMLSIFVVLLLTIIFLIVIYKKEKEFEKKREKIFNNYDEILKEAHHTAEQIVAKATEEGTSMQKERETFHKEMLQKLQESFQALLNTNKQTLENDSQELLKSFQEYLQKLKSTYEEQIEDTLKNIHSETLQALNSKLQDTFEKTQLEIAEYKKHKLQEVQKSIDTLLLRVSQEVLGHALPLADHQKLILDALEKAQKEQMFV